MRSEWRSNIWMLLELIISGTALWIVFAFLCYMGQRYIVTKGYDVTDVYAAEIQHIPADNPNYTEPDSLAAPDADLRRLVRHLSANKYVEAVSVGNNAMPYTFNFAGSWLMAWEADSVIMYRANERGMTPETFRMLGIEGADGTSTEKLAAMLERGEYIVSEFDSEYSDNHPARLFEGKYAWLNADTTRAVRVAAVAYGVRRNDFEPLFKGVIYKPMLDDWSDATEVVFKVKPGMGQQFAESLSVSDLRSGNVFLSELQSLSDRGYKAHSPFRSQMTRMSIFVLVLMLVIFLGFMGTFWLRTQQRRGEIAMPKVCGATDFQIFRRIVSEGLLLMLLSLPCIALLEYLAFQPVTVPLIDGIEVSPGAVYAASVCTVVSMTAVIVAAIWLPARKAMQTDAAVALKDM